MFRPRAVRLKSKPNNDNHAGVKEGGDLGPEGGAAGRPAVPVPEPEPPRNLHQRNTTSSRNLPSKPPQPQPARRARIDVDGAPRPPKNSKKTPFPHGNYDSYYSYRDPLAAASSSIEHLDPRLHHFERSWFAGKRVLDIGCNAGLMTVAVAALFEPDLVLGVDIDPSLISKAQNFLAMRYSYCAPLLEAVETDNGKGGLAAAQRTSTKVSPSSLQYFPASAVASFGSCPLVRPEKLPLQDASGKPIDKLSGFPWNVRFSVTDWTRSPALPLSQQDSDISTTDPSESSTFDVILALAITKWIHINGGDPALLSFFQKLSNVISSNGILILEPQPWSSYKKRVEPVELMKLKMRPEGFVEVLQGMGFGLLRRTAVGADDDEQEEEKQHDEESHGKKRKKSAFSDRELLIFRRK